jgi:hypothetical protein
VLTEMCHEMSVNPDAVVPASSTRRECVLVANDVRPRALRGWSLVRRRRMRNASSQR